MRKFLMTGMLSLTLCSCSNITKEENLWCLVMCALLLCHYLGDFCLTTKAIIRAKSNGSELQYILLHAIIHAALMTFALYLFKVPLGGCLAAFFIQFCTHFFIDTGKSILTANVEKLKDTTSKAYWVVFGFDQFLHLLVIVFFSYCYS